MRDQRRAQIKKTIRGTAEKPRLLVFRSNKYFYAQAIDDVRGETLASVDRMADPAEAGKQMAEKLQKKEVVFDRAGYKYHGNVKKFAEAAREGGLKF